MAKAFFLVPALALLGAAPPELPVTGAIPTRLISPVPATCKPISSMAQSDKARPQMKRLGELPPAEAYMAVYRTDSKGCLDPLLARDLIRNGENRPAR